MLVLTRKVGESVRIGTGIHVTILHIRGDQIRFRISTPEDVTVYREEVVHYLSEAARQALAATDSGPLLKNR